MEGGYCGGCHDAASLNVGVVMRAYDFAALAYFVATFDNFVLDTYGQIRAALELKGQKIGANDTMIAAIALAHNATLVTNNIKEFSRIEGLLLEDWTQK